MPSDCPGESTERGLPFMRVPNLKRDCLVAAAPTVRRPIAEKHLQLISPNSPLVIGNRRNRGKTCDGSSLVIAGPVHLAR
jgi:hypothetical protein